MTTDTETALKMIKAEVGPRANMNTLRAFLFIAKCDRCYASDLERELKASSGTVSRALAFWTDKNLVVKETVLHDLRLRLFRITYEGRSCRADSHRRTRSGVRRRELPALDGAAPGLG
jgi:DNA-binding MarR family transcriptional regulator